MDWMLSHLSATLLYATIVLFFASMFYVLSGRAQLHTWKHELAHWNRLITEHVRKTAHYDRALRNAFHDFELKRNAAARSIKSIPLQWDLLEKEMGEAWKAWHHFDDLMQAYERARREPAVPATKAPSG